MTNGSLPTQPRRRRARAAAFLVAATLALSGAAVATPVQAADGDVVIDLGQMRQEIRGFGAMSHSAWIGDLTPTQRDTAFDNGPDDLGLSVLRIPVPESRADFGRDLETARAAVQKGAIVFASPWNPPAEFTETFEMEPPAVGSKFQAEAGSLVQAHVSTAQPGYEEAGYVEFDAATGASVQFDGIALGSTGTKNLAFRYALASGSETVDVYIDGVLAQKDVVFAATGGASVWARKNIQVPMTSGQHSVRVVTTGTGGPSLDSMQVSAYVPPGQAKRLRHDRYAEYAAYLDEYVSFMRANGVELYAISIQNEPDYAHEWTWWTPTEILTFLRDEADVISTRVIAPESYQYRKEMSDPILNDPQALANTDIIGAHLYGTALDDFDYPLFEEKSTGQELWMTEVYVPNSTAGSADNWPEALEVGEHVHHAMADAQFQTYVWWYLRRSYGPMLEDGSISKRGYNIAHYAKFVRPGDTRLEATKSPRDGVLTSAYLRRDGSIVLVAVNSTEDVVEQGVSVPGGDTGRVDGWTTDATRDMAQLSPTESTADRFIASLPAQSISTFVVQPKDGSGIPISATVDEQGDGSLALTVADHGDTLDLGVASNAGDRVRVEGELPVVTVTDSRSDAQAGQGGWALTGSASGFEGPSVYGGEHLGWTARHVDEDSSVELGLPVAGALSGGPGLATPRILAQADPRSRFGSTRVTATLALELPVQADPGVYRGRLTLSLFAAD